MGKKPAISTKKKTNLYELTKVATPVQFENLLKFDIQVLQNRNFL